MDTVQSLIDQQLGFRKWRKFDQAMVRFRCSKKEVFTRLPSENSVPVDSPIFACKFANKKGYMHILALSNEEGELAIYNTINKQEQHGKQIHHNAIFDLAWMFHQMKLVTVSGDHTARLIDVGNGEICVEKMFSGHTRSIKTVAIKQNDSSVFATGSRDGSILVWDIRSSLSYNFVSAPDRIIHNAHFAKTSLTPTSKRRLPAAIFPHMSALSPYLSGADSVTGLAFQDENTLVSCSAGYGTIKVWDLRKSYKNSKKEPCPKSVLSYSGNTRCGYSNLIFDKDCTKLYANCLDHIIYCYNMSTYNPNPIMKYTGHQNKSFYVRSCLSSDGLYLLSGSSDQNAYIWNTSYPDPLVKLIGHTAEVTCVAWCQDNDQAIVTCSDDMRHQIWRIGSEILPDNWEVVGRGFAEPVAKPIALKRTHIGTTANKCKKLKLCKVCSYLDDKFCELCGALPNSSKRLTENNMHNNYKRLCTNHDLNQTLPEEGKNFDRKHKRLETEGHENVSCRKKLKLTDIKSSNENLDLERNLTREVQGLTSGSSSKIRKPNNNSSRSISIKKQLKPASCGSSQSPLLKFFKITDSSIINDNPNISKSNQNNFH